MEFLNLVHFCNSYLQDPEKARDIAQDTLLTLWKQRERLSPDRNIRALVFTIARNRTLDELRSRQAFSRTPEGLATAIGRLEDNSVEEYISRLELRTLMRNVWEKLPPKIHNTFRMSRLDGMKNREIAQEEGISEKAVEYRIRVVLRRVQKELEKYLG